MPPQTFKRWHLHDAIPPRLDILSVRDDFEGLCVLLAAEGKEEPLAQLCFRGFLAYRNINESYRLRTWSSPEWQASGSNLTIVENSRWLRWLTEESGGILEQFDVTHYAIYTMDYCLDVAAKAPPLLMISTGPA